MQLQCPRGYWLTRSGAKFTNWIISLGSTMGPLKSACSLCLSSSDWKWYSLLNERVTPGCCSGVSVLRRCAGFVLEGCSTGPAALSWPPSVLEINSQYTSVLQLKQIWRVCTVCLSVVALTKSAAQWSFNNTFNLYLAEEITGAQIQEVHSSL